MCIVFLLLGISCNGYDKTISTLYKFITKMFLVFFLIFCIMVYLLIFVFFVVTWNHFLRLFKENLVSSWIKTGWRIKKWTRSLGNFHWEMEESTTGFHEDTWKVSAASWTTPTSFFYFTILISTNYLKSDLIYINNQLIIILIVK